MTRAAIYARVSSEKQKETESIKSQLGILPGYVQRQGWELAGVYTDEAKSAKTGQLAKRDGWARLIRDAEARLFDVLVVLDISRLTRTNSIEERAQILGPFQRLGIDIFTPSSGRQDLRSFMGEFYATLQAMVSAEDNRKRIEAITAGKLRAIAEGRKPAGPTPFGYSYDRKAGWSIHEEHAQLVREMFRRVVGGESCQAIGDDLASRGLQRPRGGEWSMERVWQLVTSRTYLGAWTADKRKGLTVPVPRIIDDETWYTAQAALARHQRRGLRRTTHVYLLESLAVCALCGGRVHVSSHGPLVPSTYVCRWRRRPARGQAPCTLPHRRTSEVDERVWNELRVVFERGDILERAVSQRAAEAGADRAAWAGDLQDAHARLARLQAVEEALMARFRRGLISEGAMDAELGAAARERVLLQRQVQAAREGAAGARAGSARLRDARTQIDTLRRVLRSRSPLRRRELVVALMGQSPVILSAEEVRAMVRLRLAPARAVGLVGGAGLSVSHETNASDLVEIELIA